MIDAGNDVETGIGDGTLELDCTAVRPWWDDEDGSAIQVVLL